MKNRIVVAFVMAFLMAGCAEEEPTAQTTPAATAAATATTSPTAAPVTCEKETGGNKNVRMLLTDVDVGPQARADRVVFHFEAGEGSDADTPYFETEFVEPPLTEDPTGDEITVAGLKHLRLIIWASGVDLGAEGYRETYTGPKMITPEGTELVTEVREAGDFENTMTWYIGLDSEDACYDLEIGGGSFSVSFPWDQ